MPVKVARIVFPGARQARLESIEEDLTPHGDRVLVQYDYSAVSAGTEIANYRANTSYVRYPFHPGYSATGRVVAAGPDVRQLKAGDRVMVVWCSHRSHSLVRECNLVRIDETSVTQQEAAFVNIASFAFLGVRKLRIQLGESALVAGQGILGAIAAQLARLSGAYPVIVTDFSEERRNLALSLGADFAFSPGEADLTNKIRNATGWARKRPGRGEPVKTGPDVVVEVTGQAAALQQALECVAWEGRIALLGCTRVSYPDIDLYHWVHRRGVSLIGAHADTRPAIDSREGAWTERDDYQTFLRLIAAGRLRIAPLISTVAPASSAGEVYHDLAENPNPPLGVLFDWTGV
jgi:2-desacetyl-2-hydroxyethyl bacteriochlorophyllide A dehydrogenase